MIRLAVIGLGKMGLSHYAIARAHPQIELVAVCDTSDYVLSVLNKYTGVKTYTDHRALLAAEKLDAVLVATPSKFHAQIVEDALSAGLHVFCEKPFCLDVQEGERLADLADRLRRVTQVGYHYRFVGAFEEMKRLLDLGVVGHLHHIEARAYGPVVLRPSGSTWRSNKKDGGGCLYDYAIHAIDLVNHLVGRPQSVSGSIVKSLFSRDVDDEVYSSLHFADGLTGKLSANWSDEAHRKMSTTVTVWGTNGNITADRQEVRVFLRDNHGFEEFEKGWNVRYTTELTNQVWFYLRGEEYSAQIDHFVQAVAAGNTATRCSFRAGVDADMVAAAIARDAERGSQKFTPVAASSAKQQAQNFWSSLQTRWRTAEAPSE